MDKRNESTASDPDVIRFNRWAPTYDQSLMQSWFFGPVHTNMIRLLMREGLHNPLYSIIDLGCGTGRLLQNISTHWPQAQVFGVDPAEEMLCEAHRQNPNASFMLAPAESLPLPDDSVDIALSSISFHHWADPERGVQEVARVLRPGGWFCLADHIFLPARLFGDKVRSKKEIGALMIGAGLTIHQHYRMAVRFVLITLAQKPIPNE
jgi:ubiquinone/menaquinone biosynthesis C-methylase UbiE